MRTITLLVAGPIKSRLNSAFTLQDLENSLKVFRFSSPSGKIVISTYEREIPPTFHNLVDLIIINKDPGPDNFQPNPWPIEIGKRKTGANYNRLITTTLNGLMACDEGFVIKTRVELLPRKAEDFTVWLEQTIEAFNSNPAFKVGFFLEHYSGISFSINGLLGGIPDTLQIGTKVDLTRFWRAASNFWNDCLSTVTRKSNRFPLTSEQLIGMSFLQEFHGFNMKKRVKKINRYYRSAALVKAILKSERESFFWTSYKNSGFQSDYLKKSLTLDISSFYVPKTYLEVLKKLILVQFKMVYHHYRRYFVAFRKLLVPAKSKI